MSMEKPVLRTDFITRKKEAKSSLFRLVAQDGFLLLDLSQNLPGRGYYVAKTAETIRALRDGRLLLKKKLPPLQEGDLAQLEELIHE